MEEEARRARLRFWITSSDCDAIVYTLNPSCNKLDDMLVFCPPVRRRCTSTYIGQECPSSKRKQITSRHDDRIACAQISTSYHQCASLCMKESKNRMFAASRGLNLSTSVTPRQGQIVDPCHRLPKYYM